MTSNKRADMKKIHFALEPDEMGYPPVSVETVWGQEDEDGHFVIQNIPFFIKEATLDDVVMAALEDDVLCYKATVKRSKNSLLRVACCAGVEPAEVSAQLEKLGCLTEVAAAYSLVAVSIPPEVNLTDIQAVLEKGAREEKWDYEEPLLRQ